MPHRPQQRVKFISHQTESTPEGHCRAEVTLDALSVNATGGGAAWWDRSSPKRTWREGRR